MRGPGGICVSGVALTVVVVVSGTVLVVVVLAVDELARTKSAVTTLKPTMIASAATPTPMRRRM